MLRCVHNEAGIPIPTPGTHLSRTDMKNQFATRLLATPPCGRVDKNHNERRGFFPSMHLTMLLSYLCNCQCTNPESAKPKGKPLLGKRANASRKTPPRWTGKLCPLCVSEGTNPLPKERQNATLPRIAKTRKTKNEKKSVNRKRLFRHRSGGKYRFQRLLESGG